MPVHPTDAQIAALREWGDANPDEPVIMINLLRFAARAHEGYGCDGMTGQEAYAEYGRRLMALDPPFAGTPVVLAGTHVDVIAPDDEHWDQMILVRYDSAAAFMEATSRPDYLEASKCRDAALDDSRLILSTPVMIREP